MKPIFADSFYFIALASEADFAHQGALAASREIHQAIVTTTWVLTEVADALSSPIQRPVFIELMRSLKTDPSVTMLPPSSDLFYAGLDLFSRRPDKYWSLTDCISFVVMERFSMTDALTADRHFQQAGFNALLIGEQ
jgi:predicted nucleic acid-binding protein